MCLVAPQAVESPVPPVEDGDPALRERAPVARQDLVWLAVRRRFDIVECVYAYIIYVYYICIYNVYIDTYIYVYI